MYIHAMNLQSNKFNRRKIINNDGVFYFRNIFEILVKLFVNMVYYSSTVLTKGKCVTRLLGIKTNKYNNTTLYSKVILISEF